MIVCWWLENKSCFFYIGNGSFLEETRYSTQDTSKSLQRLGLFSYSGKNAHVIRSLPWFLAGSASTFRMVQLHAMCFAKLFHKSIYTTDER